MKINELVTLMSNNKLLKPEQVQVFLKKELDVKEYMSIKDKKNLIDDIINDCIFYENDIFKFDNIDKYIGFTMKTIAAYTNLELSNDIEKDYDALCMAGLLNPVINTFVGEYENIKLLLQMKCDYILSDNSLEAQFSKFLNNISNKIDNLTDKIDHFDISKLLANKDIFMKFIDLAQHAE